MALDAMVPFAHSAACRDAAMRICACRLIYDVSNVDTHSRARHAMAFSHASMLRRRLFFA